MATTIKIDGSPVSLTSFDVWPGRLSLRRGGISTLALTRRGKIPPSPDPKLYHEIQVLFDGVLVFTGDIYDHEFSWAAGVGWVTTYQAKCLRNRGDQVPFIDENTKTTTAAFNLPRNDPLYFPSRSGKTVGEVVADCLTMIENATALDALGIGGYVSLSPPTLPTPTLDDLAALNQLPPQSLVVMGPKVLSAVDSFVQSATPNVNMIVQADGVIRFLDLRDAVEQTLTMDDCDQRVDVASLSVRRSLADCRSAVEIFGKPLAIPKMVSLSNGGLEEVFAWGSYGTNAAAKAAWTPDDYYRSKQSRAYGTCSCTDTLNVVVDPVDDTQEWDADAFDQANQQGTLHLAAPVISGVDSIIERRVVTHTALTAGGTSTMTLDSALPATDYTKFWLYGLNTESSLVYRRYRVVDPDMRAALARQFNPSAVWINSTGDSVTVTNFPMASVCWDPFNEVTDDFVIDIEDGAITFVRPTFITAGNQEPSDVRVLIAVNAGVLNARAPVSGFEGTAYDEYGCELVHRHEMKTWTDPGNAVAMQAYAQEVLDGVKDVAIDVTVDVAKIWTPALDFANGLSIDALGYDTGLEGANLPIVNVDVTWNVNTGSNHTMTIAASNRRGVLQPENLLPPERPRQGFNWGTSQGTFSALGQAKP